MKYSYRMTHEKIIKQIQQNIFHHWAKHRRLGSFISCEESGNKKYSLYSINQKDTDMKEDLRETCNEYKMSVQADCL